MDTLTAQTRTHMVGQIRLYNGVASKDIIRYTEENSTTNYKKILRLYSLGINKTCIVESYGCVCSTVIVAI